MFRTQSAAEHNISTQRRIARQRVTSASIYTQEQTAKSNVYPLINYTAGCLGVQIKTNLSSKTNRYWRYLLGGNTRMARVCCLTHIAWKILAMSSFFIQQQQQQHRVLCVVCWGACTCWQLGLPAKSHCRAFHWHTVRFSPPTHVDVTINTSPALSTRLNNVQVHGKEVRHDSGSLKVKCPSIFLHKCSFLTTLSPTETCNHPHRETDWLTVPGTQSWNSAGRYFWTGVAALSDIT